MHRIAPLLTIDPHDVADAEIHVLEREGVIAGFYRLRRFDDGDFLDDLWVDPPSIGTGAGKRLWEHAIRRARDLGWTTISIESDPGAEGFYLSRGAARVGTRRSPSGRDLPFLSYAIRKD